MYFISLLCLENIEVCAKTDGQTWSGRLQVTVWSANLRRFQSLEKALGTRLVVSRSERLRHSLGHHAYGSAARPLRSQVKGGFRRPRVHPLQALAALSALPVPYQELQSLENVFLNSNSETVRLLIIWLIRCAHAYLRC